MVPAPPQASARHNRSAAGVNDGTMRARRRRWRIPRLAIATAVVLPVAVWAATLGGGIIIGAGPRGEGCRSFWGESVDRVAWSPSGEFLAVTTTSSDGLDNGDESLRVFRWPGMELASVWKEAHGTSGYTIDDMGVVAWSVEGFRDSSAIRPVPPVQWRLEPGAAPKAAQGEPTGPSRNVRASSDRSSLGTVAKASAPGPERPNQLCVHDAAND